MSKEKALMVFQAGFAAASSGESLFEAWDKFRATIPKRKRRWFKKPK